VSRFLRIRRRQLGLNASLFFIFGAVALALAGPKVAAGYREAAPPLPTLTPVVGPVSRVTDGDTFWIGRQKIRLWGIDAPEAATPNGSAATRYLAEVVAKHPLTCRQAGRPSYDRLVARCVDPRGRDVAEVMVGAGWALDWPEFSKGRYRQAQDRAAALRAGMHGQALAEWR
jgi:endonuclease YncB( thermonuclease family)